jgi:hypothetical protein
MHRLRGTVDCAFAQSWRGFRPFGVASDNLKKAVEIMRMMYGRLYCLCTAHNEPSQFAHVRQCTYR